jgi:hypothetical protein
VRNVLDSIRFTDEELVRMAAAWHELDTHWANGEQLVLFDRGRSAPRAPHQEESDLVLDMEAQLFPEIDDCTWWCRYMCRCRDRFIRTAICVWSDCDWRPRKIYMPVLLLQSPMKGIFLSADLCEDQTIARYSFNDLVFLPCHALPFTDADELWMYKSAFFRNNDIVCSSAPVPFEEFVAMHPKTDANRSTATRANNNRLHKTEIDDLLELFPWLSRDDFCEPKEKATCKGGAGGGGGGSIDEVRRMDDDDREEHYLSVLDELAEKRGKYDAQDDPDIYGNFYIKILGGKWTKTFIGVAADSVVCIGRSHVRPWCNLFGWPKTRTFTFKTYGELEAVGLAREYARRAHHFFTLYLSSPDVKNWMYSASDLDSYVEGEAFLDFALSIPMESPAFDRVIELRRMLPINFELKGG